MSVTMSDIARELALSQAAVSLVLNGKDHGRVSPKKAALIRETAAALGYQTNLAAVSLRKQKSYTIGVLLPSPKDGYYGTLVADLQHEVSEAGYIANFAFWESVEEARRNAELMLSRQVDAIVTSEPSFLPDGLDIPVVSYSTPDPRFDCICHDALAEMTQRLDYLMALGHRQISYFPERKNCGSTQTFHDGLKKRGLSHIPQPSLRSAEDFYTMDWGAYLVECFDHVCDGKPRPTAILARNDNVGIAVLRRAWERGIRVPKELSVIGVDNIQAGAYSIPGLTTVATFLTIPVARQLMALILSRMEDPSLLPRTQMVSVKLIERESCAPPSSRTSE